MNSIAQIRSKLRELSNPVIAAHSQRFFKTGPGEYGEGDVFLGIRVPVLRGLAKENRELTLPRIRSLLCSPIHEDRLLALLILVLKFSKADAANRQLIFDFYCKHMQFVNNWDLVDSSAHLIVGPHLAGRSRKLLHTWCKSESLWVRRIAVMSTLHFIKRGEFDETLRIAQALLGDPQDLIHKAVGWMLREIGNRNRSVEEAFLKEHYANMPRTMLRYAIEKFPAAQRKRYLTGQV